jgi:hypothetical protein
VTNRFRAAAEMASHRFELVVLKRNRSYILKCSCGYETNVLNGTSRMALSRGVGHLRQVEQGLYGEPEGESAEDGVSVPETVGERL